MELVVFVCARRGVAVPFLGDGVHDHGPAVVLGSAQGGLNRFLVVPVDRAHIFHAQIFEDAAGDHHIFNTGLHAVQAPVNHLPERAAALQLLTHSVQRPVVPAVQAHLIHLLLHVIFQC